MSKITILDTPNVTLWYHPEEKIIHHHIFKFICGEEFHHLLLTGTETLIKYGAQKWLSNTQSDVLLRPEDLEWGKINWFPRTVAAGWKHWAVVQPHSVFVQIEIDPVVQQYAEAGINAKFFIDEEEAFRWLVNQ